MTADPHTDSPGFSACKRSERPMQWPAPLLVAGFDRKARAGRPNELLDLSRPFLLPSNLEWFEVSDQTKFFSFRKPRPKELSHCLGLAKRRCQPLDLGTIVPAFPSQVPRFAPTTTRTSESVAAKSRQEKLCWATTSPFRRKAT